LLVSEPLAAPHLLHAEVANILRRAELHGDISADTASLAHGDLLDLRVELYPYGPLAERVLAIRKEVLGDEHPEMPGHDPRGRFEENVGFWGSKAVAHPETGEILVFNSAYADNADKVDLDKIVIVRGRVDHKEAGETKLVAQEVTPFEPTEEELLAAAEQAVVEAVVRRLTLEVSPGVPAAFLEELKRRELPPR
jgi:hypothetical protein